MKNVIVTGGTGFLGKRVCEMLINNGYIVKAIGRNIEIGKKLEDKGIKFCNTDLLNKEKLIEDFKNADIILHCAAKSSLWGEYKEFYETNVIGTQNVIEAFKINNGKLLVYVSSPTIYYDNNDLNNFNDVNKKPKKFINYYAETKWIAQEKIDEAYSEGLNTISIIPRGIFGPEDSSIFPRLLKINSKFGIPLINEGRQLVDMTYIDNVADALILCIDSDKKCYGKKYFITNDESYEFKELLEKVFKKLDVKLKYRKRTYIKMKIIANLIESVYKLFKIKKEPLLTKYSVEILSKNQTFDISNAINELGYIPKISIEEGIEKFAEWWFENDKKV